LPVFLARFHSETQLFVRVFGGCRRVPVSSAAFVLRSISVGLSIFMAIFIMFSDCLEMVIGCSDVAGCGKMMVLARRMALGVRHSAFLPVDEEQR
jgi:hypothetical protein